MRFLILYLLISILIVAFSFLSGPKERSLFPRETDFVLPSIFLLVVIFLLFLPWFRELPRTAKKDQVNLGELKGCIKTLLAIEGGSFPDETCRTCKNLKECLKLEAEVRGGLVRK